MKRVKFHGGFFKSNARNKNRRVISDGSINVTLRTYVSRMMCLHVVTSPSEGIFNGAPGSNTEYTGKIS
jgi:hypothetical protein